MSESSLSPEDMVRQARNHLESLKAAGVEWLPAAPPLTNIVVPAVSAPADRIPDTAPGGPPPAPAPTVSPAASLVEETAAASPASLAPALPLEARRRELQLLADKVTGCMRCAELCSTRTQTVFGVGSPGVELCFVGEAPGADEDRQGEPFVGAAGQLLNRIIAACGMRREEVYICNILKCRPPGNRQPLPNEAANCREYLERQLELVAPKFICAMGATAVQHLLGTTLSVGKLRGRFQEYRGIPVMCTYHPAYLLRTPEKKRDVWEDMKKLLERMGRPVPAAGARQQ